MSALQTQPSALTPIPDVRPLERTAPTTGVIAFVTGATFLFGAVLVAYGVVRARTPVAMPALPWVFWISTFVVLVSSLMLQYAYQSAKLMHGVAAHRAILAAAGLTYLFVGLQAPGLLMLGEMSYTFRNASTALYLITFLLIGLHLLHVIGGLVALTRISLASEKHHYERDDVGQLRPMMIYHHYMTAIWFIIFTALLVLN